MLTRTDAKRIEKAIEALGEVKEAEIRDSLKSAIDQLQISLERYRPAYSKRPRRKRHEKPHLRLV